MVTYLPLCSTCLTYRTLCHAIGHQLLPTNPFTTSATDLRERFLLSGVFCLTLFAAFFKASLGAGSSTSRLAGLHADLCLNHSNPQNFFLGRFYLSGRAGQSRNINIYVELALQNVSFKMSASHGI